MDASGHGGAPEPIRESKVILAEGVDAKLFLTSACRAYGADGIEVRDFGGNAQLRPAIRALKLTTGFGQVRCLVVARDAESNADAAMDSVADALAHVGLPRPTEPFSFASGTDEEQPRTAIMIFPGSEAADGERWVLKNGTLEDLCLATVPDSDAVLTCVDEYLKCVRKIPGDPPDATKSRLHAYLSGKAGLAGLKLGEVTKAKAWDLEHPALTPFKSIIQHM